MNRANYVVFNIYFPESLKREKNKGLKVAQEGENKWPFTHCSDASGTFW